MTGGHGGLVTPCPHSIVHGCHDANGSVAEIAVWASKTMPAYDARECEVTPTAITHCPSSIADVANFQYVVVGTQLSTCGACLGQTKINIGLWRSFSARGRHS